jgi:pyruvate/2-oxoglutarate dehydrogenase complex dihydrolipoamide acyltransferase (E2) component
MAYKMSSRRKLAIASWSSPREGNIYGKLTLDMTDALKYMQYLREKTGEKITITHLVGKAVGMALKSAPDVNGRLFLGCYIPHETADVAFLVSLGEGEDLGKFKVSNVDLKTTADIARELREGSERIRKGKDADFEKSKPLIKALPTWLLRPILWLTGYIAGAAGISVKPLGLERFPFGGAIVTSVGMLGIDEGYAPPTPFARVPVYIAVPSIKERAVVKDGQIVIRSELDLMATIDHRFMDGHRGALIARTVRKCMHEPWTMDGYETKPC